MLPASQKDLFPVIADEVKQYHDFMNIKITYVLRDGGGYLSPVTIYYLPATNLYSSLLCP